MSKGPVLVSWVAVANDPFERDRRTGERREVDGEPIPGPTLTLLCDNKSKYYERIHDVVLLHQSLEQAYGDRERRAVGELVAELEKRSYRVQREVWDGDDPTDHQGIFTFLKVKLPEIRRQFPGRELVLHISPGTPSMHTVWVLMAETGFVEPPFSVVKSYRRVDRRGRPAVVPVEVGIESFYKAYKASRPRQVPPDEQVVDWDPRYFQTDAMKRVFAEARRFAKVNVPVLIRGERGTGKTTLANWIRSNSAFRRQDQDARWPSVACGQYSPETMRAELFGYVKGAFTGATSDHAGILASAHGDTLFLDEVGDISRDLQRLLIRAVEEKQYFAVGSDQSCKSDFRLLTATNIDDRQLKDRLDPDFLDRISLLTISLPPLREVSDELPRLWAAVYERARRRAGVSPEQAQLGAQDHDRVVAALQRHPLPGNIRELLRVAYRILAARADDDAPMPAADAAMYGLEALAGGSTHALTRATTARSLAGAFAEGTAMDGFLVAQEALSTDAVLGEFKAFLATELRRIARDRGVNSGSLCDRTDRVLLDWSKATDGRQKNTSASRKKSSDLG